MKKVLKDRACGTCKGAELKGGNLKEREAMD
jgi:hypothetical protein